MNSSRRPLLAHTAPFIIFLAFLGLGTFVASLFRTSGILWLADPKYWIFPLQTVVCGGFLLAYWRNYEFAPLGRWPFGFLVGVVALGIWISPQVLFGMAPRLEGFDPDPFAATPLLYWLTVGARFARLVIVVPLVEEIFWRGFFLRYLVNENFTQVAFGTYRPFSFFAVAGLFMLGHSWDDYPAAFLTGILYNAVAVRTKSLFACVVAHAVTNLGLGLYIMATKQWGFW